MKFGDGSGIYTNKCRPFSLTHAPVLVGYFLISPPPLHSPSLEIKFNEKQFWVSSFKKMA